MHRGNFSVDPLGQLDLNLLRTLAVLLEERSVTRAAALLGRSQPAVSRALGRLRDAIGDPLLVREGRGLVPTARGEAMLPPLRQALDDLGAAVEGASTFDPATARRTFVLAGPDAMAPVLPDILAALREAPGVTLELRSAARASDATGADLVVGVLPDEAPGLMARPLGLLRYRVAMRSGHPAQKAPWTVETYTAWPHILVSLGPEPTPVARAVAAAGSPRRIGLVVPTFLLAAHAATCTDHLFTAPGALLERLVPPLDLVVRDLPLHVAPLRVAALWPERLGADPGHRWFRRRVIDVLDRVLAAPVR